jgi:hypothetical protein
MPEILWKAYIDFEVDEQGDREKTRSLYERLVVLSGQFFLVSLLRRRVCPNLRKMTMYGWRTLGSRMIHIAMLLALTANNV